MPLYHLVRKARRIGYDQYTEHMVFAPSEDDARKLCPFAGEGKDAWMNPKRSTCEEVKPEGEPHVLISSFYAG